MDSILAFLGVFAGLPQSPVLLVLRFAKKHHLKTGQAGRLNTPHQVPKGAVKAFRQVGVGPKP